MAPDGVERPVSPDQLDKAKKWALMKFREMLRGQRVTEQFKRYLSGELGPEYRFNVEMVVNDEMYKFIGDPKNAERLSKETLIP